MKRNAFRIATCVVRDPQRGANRTLIAYQYDGGQIFALDSEYLDSLGEYPLLPDPFDETGKDQVLLINN